MYIRLFLALLSRDVISSPAALSANESGYTHHIDMKFGDTIAHVLCQSQL